MIYIKNLSSSTEIAKTQFEYIIKKFFNIVTEKPIRKRHVNNFTF